MIWKVAFLGATIWFNWYLVRLLYVAKTRGYVMALTDPFRDTREMPQTREAAPFKFWGNVIISALMLPFAVAGLCLAIKIVATS